MGFTSRARHPYLTALLLFGIGISSAAGQNPVSTVSMQSSYAALSGSTVVQDGTLSGTFDSYSGSDHENGPLVMEALSTGSSRVDLTEAAGVVSEIRNNSSGGPGGVWVGSDGTRHSMSQFNVLTEPAWFLPNIAVGRILSSSAVVSDVGRETKNGISVEHFSVVQSAPALAAPVEARYEHLTKLDIFVDPTTNLPVAMSFNSHPDSDSNIDIPVEIRFSAYTAVNGVQVPFSIQKYVNNGLVLDAHISSAQFNTGIPAQTFSLQ